MTLDILITVVLTLVVFTGGIAMGAYLYRAGHRHGVTLVDRIKHDMVPFGELADETEIQAFTDGTLAEEE